MAGERELDGIAHQVVQDLPQPQGIAHQQGRRFHIGDGIQLQPLLLGTRQQARGHAVEQFGGRERMGLQLQPARLDGRQVQAVVDDAQQGGRRLLHGPQVACLFGRNPGQGQQLQRSQDAKERRPYFMAHGGQKLRLGLACRFGAQLGIDQRCLRLPERRHIADQAENHRFAPVGRGRGADLHPSPIPQRQLTRALLRAPGHGMLEPGSITAHPLPRQSVGQQQAAIAAPHQRQAHGGGVQQLSAERITGGAGAGTCPAPGRSRHAAAQPAHAPCKCSHEGKSQRHGPQQQPDMGPDQLPRGLPAVCKPSGVVRGFAQQQGFGKRPACLHQ